MLAKLAAHKNMGTKDWHFGIRSFAYIPFHHAVNEH